MGVFDMAKIAKKAMQAKSRMSKINAAGKSGSLSILIDGLYSVLETEIDREELRRELGGDVDDKLLDKIISVFSKNIKDSFNSSKKALEKELASSANLEDLKGLLS